MANIYDARDLADKIHYMGQERAAVKNVNCKCSAACRTWFCCQDCDLKTSCKNPCENAFNTKLCEHFEKREDE